MQYRWFAAFAAAFLFSGCSLFYKPLRIDRAHHPFGQIRQIAMKSLPVGLRSSSPNGRELHSQYFLPDKGGYKAAIEEPVRLTAKIVILNERRPYEIEIYVFREERVVSGGRVSYKVRGQDFRIANMIKEDIQTRLAQRREDLNIIDDFRVF